MDARGWVLGGTGWDGSSPAQSEVLTPEAPLWVVGQGRVRAARLPVPLTLGTAPAVLPSAGVPLALPAGCHTADWVLLGGKSRCSL